MSPLVALRASLWSGMALACDVAWFTGISEHTQVPTHLRAGERVGVTRSRQPRVAETSCSTAQAVICPREAKPSLSRMLLTCRSAVRREITSLSAICGCLHRQDRHPSRVLLHIGQRLGE